MAKTTTSEQPTFFALHRETLVEKKPAPASPPSTPPLARSGEQLKREGQERARDAKADAVGYARELAHDIARGRADKCCSMLLVNESLAAEGRPGLGNAAGGVFLTTVWIDTGRRVKDTRPHARSNEILVWRLRHDN